MTRIAFLFFVLILTSLPVLLAQSRYQGIWIDGEESFFREKDYAAYAKLPHIYQLILNNDLTSLRVAPLKAINKFFRLSGETYSPLSFACKHGKTEAAHILIDKGASITFTNNYGESPLHFLCFSGSNDTLLAKKLIFSTVFTKEDKNEHTPLYYAMESGNNDLFDFILSEYAKTCTVYNSPEIKECFIYARENLHVIEKTCKLFDLNKPFFTDKSRIFFERYLPIDNIIEKTIFYNGRRIYGQESERPKDESIDLKIFRVLIGNGMDINIKFEGGQSILYKIHENKILVKFLCEKVKALNSYDDEGRTFLEFYINSCISPPQIAFNKQMVYAFDKDRDYSADLDVIEYLISRGAIVNKPYADGWVFMMLQALDLKNEYILKQFIHSRLKIIKENNLLDLLAKFATPDQIQQVDILIKNE